MLRAGILFLVLMQSSSALAYFQMDLLKGRSGRAESQWTLAGWLSQKESMRFADQWLAANRQDANLFELDLSGGSTSYEVKTTNASGVQATADESAQSYGLNLYIWLLNLYGEYEKTSNNREAFGGAAGLRLFGAHSQTTSLVARYGYRKTHDFFRHEIWENQYIEGLLQLYLISQFGVQGTYRYYLPSESNLGNELSGHRVRGGVFFEFGILRIFADYFQEPIEISASGATTKEERSGYDFGAKLYF